MADLSVISAKALKPLINEKNEEIKQKAISHVEKLVNRKTPTGGKYNKTPTSTEAI